MRSPFGLGPWASEEAGLFSRSTVLLAAAVSAAVAAMIVPLPAWLFDAWLGFSIAFSLGLLVATLQQRRQEFAAFPTWVVLLVLMRAGLHVAAVRLVVRSQGTALMRAFGGDAVGHGPTGALATGGAGADAAAALVAFVALALVQYVVLAKGAERIAEVSARFGLDALPGKHMGLETELRQHLIAAARAQRRRADMEQESQWLAAMDGAMKFVRNDSVVTLAIVAFGWAAGTWAGIRQLQLPIVVAAGRYARVALGYGIAAQLGLVLLSTAATLLLTQTARRDGASLSQSLFGPLLGSASIWYVVSILCVAAGLSPGFSLFPWWVLGSAFGLLGVWVARNPSRGDALPARYRQPWQRSGPMAANVHSAGFAHAAHSSRGYQDHQDHQGHHGRSDGLSRHGWEIVLPRALGTRRLQTQMRAQLMREQARIYETLGVTFAFPAISVRDDADTMQVQVQLESVTVREWQGTHEHKGALRSRQQDADRAARIVREFCRVYLIHAHELFGLDEIADHLDAIELTNPALVREAVPRVVDLTALTHVARHLVEEGVGLQHLPTVLSYYALRPELRGSSTATLYAHARRALRRLLSYQLIRDGELRVVTLERTCEEWFRDHMRTIGSVQRIQLGTEERERWRGALEHVQREHVPLGEPLVLLTADDLRKPLFDVCKASIEQLHVLAHTELLPEVRLRSVASLGNPFAIDIDGT
jgi:type III secretion protein V